jgi:hypothetical protein
VAFAVFFWWVCQAADRRRNRGQAEQQAAQLVRDADRDIWKPARRKPPRGWRGARPARQAEKQAREPAQAQQAEQSLADKAQALTEASTRSNDSNPT